MKQTTIILLFIIIIGCHAQNPDTLTYFSIKYVDSLINDYETRIINLQSIFDANIYETNQDTILFIANDGNIKITIEKEGTNIWYDLICNNKRINADFIEGERKIIMMDSTHTIGSMSVNNESTKGTAFIDFKH